MRRQLKQLEKIFANHVTDKGFVKKMYNEFKKISNETAIQFKKLAKDLSWNFSKGKIQIPKTTYENAQARENTNKNHNEIIIHSR